MAQELRERLEQRRQAQNGDRLGLPLWNPLDPQLQGFIVSGICDIYDAPTKQVLLLSVLAAAVEGVPPERWLETACEIWSLAAVGRLSKRARTA